MSYRAKYPAAFINVIAEDGTKAEAIEWLQRTWDELQALRLQCAMWIKTSDQLPPRNVPVLAAWPHGGAWQYNVVKFGGKRWLDVIPDDDDDWQWSTPDYWRAIEAPRPAAETSAVRPDSCHCPSVPGEDCKLTAAECERRTQMNR